MRKRQIWAEKEDTEVNGKRMEGGDAGGTKEVGKERHMSRRRKGREAEEFVAKEDGKGKKKEGSARINERKRRKKGD